MFYHFIRNLAASKLVVRRMMLTFRRFSLLAISAFIFNFAAHSDEARPAVDWSKFLARHDLVWNSPATNWETGAFIGNGLLGAMIYSGGTNALQWDIGRSDVTDKGDRIAIGRFVLHPGGEVLDKTMHLDLWNAEARGELKLDGGGVVEWRSLTHAKDLVNAIEYWTQFPSNGASRLEYPKFEFQHFLANPARLEYQNQPIPDQDKNPEPTEGKRTGIFSQPVHWCLQPLHNEAAYVVAWEDEGLINNHHILFFTVNFRPPGHDNTNDQALIDQTLKQLRSGMGGNFYTAFVVSHRDWWHKYYPESFLSIPDTRMESFYWIQMYKLASATRADRPAIDLLGPWFRRTPWPHIWWNLNIQLTYWPVYAANRLELGESLIHLINADRTNFINNVPAEWRSDSAGVGRSSPYSGVRSVPNATSKTGVLERGDLTWALHNYWLQYRFSGDEKLLHDGLYPMLKLSIGYYLHLLSPGPDGKLHLPVSTSPEFPKNVPDSNYDLSLLRWGLHTLLAVNERFNLNDPLATKWRDTLAQLTPNPVDADGYMVGAGQPFDQSHRHFSHLFSIYPLHLVDPQSPTDRPLIEKSLDHWASMPAKWRGYSYTGASAMSAWLGRKDDAVKYLNEFLNKGFVKPNTMYTEAGPVIETPLSGAASIHELVLQSWSMKPFGTHIRVFPAVPDSWKDVSFDKLLAEGAFEVSAVRRDDKTKFVQIKSLAGAPCRVSTSLEGKIIASGNRKFSVSTEMEDGQPVSVIDLKKGETVLLTSADEKLSPNDLTIEPVAAQSGRENFYGLPKR
jgi:alpha-L-fucosidase 2